MSRKRGCAAAVLSVLRGNRRNRERRNNMKKLFTGVLALLLMAWLAIPVETTSYTKAEENKQMAHQIAEMLRAEGHPENHPVIVACQEWWRAEDNAQKTIPEYPTKAQRAEYPVAAAVWQLLREAGLSEACAAGILGNMMAEVGGHTLDLDLYMKKDGYYGLCAWSLYYCPEVDGLGAPGQIAYLLDTLDSNMKVAGGSADTFLALVSARDTAKYFSDKYERPAVYSQQRAENAARAMEYFGG